MCTPYDLVLFFQWTNLLSPDNIKGLSPLTMLLAMAGNGLMIPRALFSRDFMWYGDFFTHPTVVFHIPHS